MFLITEKYLKERVLIKAQTDTQAIAIALQNAKDFYLVDLLGMPLYQLFDDAVNTTGTTLTEVQNILLDKVKLYNALVAHYDLMFNLFDISNKGNQSPEGSTDIELIKLKRNEVKAKAEKIKADILDYLYENRVEFSLYFGSEEAEPKAVKSSSSPIIFPNRRCN